MNAQELDALLMQVLHGEEVPPPQLIEAVRELGKHRLEAFSALNDVKTLLTTNYTLRRTDGAGMKPAEIETISRAFAQIDAALRLIAGAPPKDG